MKKFLTNISKVALLALVCWGLSAHQAHAQFSLFSLNNIAGQVVYQLGGTMVNMVLHIVGYLLVVVGMLLDISINLTMHIKDLVNSIPAIYQVWTTIRDISGLFFIFFLLYAALKMILGFDNKYGDLIKNIVIAGILINFSFFITSVLIDMSNMVSLAIYNAMLPGQEVQITNTTNIGSLIDPSGKGHALSSAFMQGLEIPTVFKAQSDADAASSANVQTGVIDAFLKIAIIGVIGIITIVIAILSFLAASIAFIVRLFVLIFLLAFSPLWFASWVIPELKEFSKKFTDMLYSQLVFMPVYLLLMYAALSIISTSPIFGSAFSSTAPSNGLPGGQYIALLINAVFVIFMLNLPLFAGLSIGGIFTGKKWGADSISKWAGKKAGSWAGRNTAGRLASIANNSGTLKNLRASNSTVLKGLANVASTNLGTVENYGFGQKKGGYKDTVKAKKEAIVKTHEDMGKASEAEKAQNKARYGDSEEGKEKLKQMLEARQKQYLSSITQPSILTTMMSGAKKATTGTVNLATGAVTSAASGVANWAKNQPDIVGYQGYNAMNTNAGTQAVKAAEAVGSGAQAVKAATNAAADTAEATIKAAANTAPAVAFSRSFGSAERDAIDEINKKKKKEDKKKAGDEAREKQKKSIANENAEMEPIETRISELGKEIRELGEQFENDTQEYETLRAKGMSATAAESQRLVDLDTAIKSAKSTMALKNKDIFNLNEQKGDIAKKYKKERDQFDAVIQEAKKLEEEDHWNKIEGKLEKLEQKESGGGGAPKPADGGAKK